MYLLGLILYAVLCAGIAWLLAKLLTRRAKAPWSQWLAAAILAPVVFFLPLADEIVGNYQFERLCEEAKEVKIYGTIPVGEELYTPEGKWRIGLNEGEWDQRMKDWNRAQKILNSYLRWDDRRPAREVSAAIPVQEYEQRIYDARTGRLLAEWHQYGTRGGWLSQSLASSGDKIIVRQQCMPEVVLQSKINQVILKFNNATEAIK